MAEVEVGITPFCGEVVRVSGEATVAGSRIKGIRAVIERMRPGVSGLDLKSLREPLGHCGLESVVIGICNRAV